MPRRLRPQLVRLEDRTNPSPFYNYDVIGRADQLGLTGITQFPSINDDGQVSFIGNSSKGDVLFVGERTGSPVNVSGPASTNLTLLASSQIGNDGKVVVSARQTSPNFRSIRVYDPAAAGPGNFAVPVGIGGLGTSVFTYASRNNDGRVVLAGIESAGDTVGLFTATTPVNGLGTRLLDLAPPQPSLRPMIADTDDTVLRQGNNPTDRIVSVNAASFSGEVIADTSRFTALGAAPGISDDGQVIAFYGNLSPAGAKTINAANGEAAPLPTADGPGVFVSIVLDGQRRTIRVAGVTGNGKIDAGERVDTASVTTPGPNFRVLDRGPDFNYDRAADWELDWNAGDADQRTAVTNPRALDPAAPGVRTFEVVFTARDKLTGAEAVYSSRVNLFADSGWGFTRVGVEPAVQVVRAGEDVPGLGVVTDLSVFDPVNATGTVAVWAAAGAVQAVVRATPTLDILPEPGGGNGISVARTAEVNQRFPFAPDSALVDQVVPGVPGNATRTRFTQVIVHATVGNERGGLESLTEGRDTSIHYLVSREGRVTQVLREGDVANHAPPTNPQSIGIELVDDYNGKANSGHRGNPTWVTDAQRQKAALLVRDITQRRGIDRFHPALLPSDFYPNGNRPAGAAFSNKGDTKYLAGTTAAPFRDGYPLAHDNVPFEAILAHGQVRNRSGGKDDPRNFDWQKFMSLVGHRTVFQLNSPATLLVTDPLGRRAGFDPATGQTVLEIPGATYTGPGTEPQSLELPDAPAGTYTTRVTGTGSGPFRLDVIAPGVDGELFATRVSGTTSAGAVTDYALTYDPADIAGTRMTGASNLPPDAVAETFFTNVDAVVLLDVLTNDSDPDGTVNPTTVELAAPPSSGTATVDPATGVITYTPPAGFSGTVTLAYRVRDDAGQVSAAATVTVVVGDPPPPQVAAADTATTAVNTPVAIDILANDRDFGEPLPGTVVVTSPPTNGSVVIDPDTGTATYTPVADFLGTDTFSYTVRNDDDEQSSDTTVTVTVTPPNTAPRVSTVGDQTIPANTATPALPFTVADDETPADQLVVTADSSNPALVPVGNIALAGTGTDRTVTVTPAAGVSGSAVITLTIRDPGGLAATSSFTLTVTVAPANTPPTVTLEPVPPLGTFRVTIGDAETPAATLTVTATVTNPAFTLTLGGSGASRSLVVASAVAGSGTVTVVVTDAGGLTATATADVTFTGPSPTNTPPRISTPADRFTNPGVPSAPAAFTLADDESPAAQLDVTATSSDPALVPVGGILFGGGGADRSVTVVPATGRTGTAVVTLTVRDPAGLTASASFTVTVVPAGANTPPRITAPTNQTTSGATPTAPAGFTLADDQSPADQLTIVVSSSDPQLVPPGNVTLAGSGTDRTVVVTPAAGRSGTATITLTVTDPGGLAAAATFTVTVSSAPGGNTPPSVSLGSPAGSRPVVIPVNVGDAETSVTALELTATSSNPALTVTTGGSGANRTVTVGAAAGGTGTITVTVRDAGGLTTTRSVSVTVGGSAEALVGVPQFAVGAGPGGSPTVSVYNPDGTVRLTDLAFDPAFTGGVRTVVADFDRDGVPDVAAGTGPGGPTRVVVYSGATNRILFDVAPFEASFTGGVYVAAGDLDGDGRPDLVVTPDEGGGPRVDVYTGNGFARSASFFGIDDPNFRGGARASTGDINGDGTADLIVVAGFGGGPRVAGFDGRSLGTGPRKVFADFFAFEPTLRNGVFVTAGDLDGDGFAELIAGGGPGGGPRVTAFSGKGLFDNRLDVRANFFGGDPDSRGGVRVTVKNLDADARADIVVGAGDGAGSRVTGYLGRNIAAAGTPRAAFDFDAYPMSTGGVFVG